MNKQNEPLNILILLTQLEYGGAQKLAFKLARYFHNNGHKIVLCFLYDKYGLMEQVRLQEPYRVIDLEAKVPGILWPINAFYTVRALVRLFVLIRQHGFRIILTLTHYSNLLGIPVAWLAKVPVRISSQHSQLISFPKWFLKIDSWLANSSLVDKMVAVSEQTRRYCIDMEGMKCQKVHTLPNGIDFEEFDCDWPADELGALMHSLGISIEARVISTIARLHPLKGHRYLVEAAPIVLEAYPDTIFLLIGDGECRDTIQQRINLLGIASNFQLLGLRANIPRLLALSDLFVLPSLSEAMPLSILEAMAAKVAVIATDLDGTRELVVQGETGILVPPADAKALGTAIISLLNDPVTRLSMGRRGHERVKTHFSEQVMCRRYEKLMRSLIDQKGRN